MDGKQISDEFNFLLKQIQERIDIDVENRNKLERENQEKKLLLEKEKQIEQEIERLSKVTVGTSDKVQNCLEKNGSTKLVSGSTMLELIRRPELDYFVLEEIDKNRPALSRQVKEQVNINIKYEGYIKRQEKQVEQFKKLENRRIPENIVYEEVNSLRTEAVQKLNQVRPSSVGQAARISGVSPADISVLLVYLEQLKRKA